MFPGAFGGLFTRGGRGGPARLEISHGGRREVVSVKAVRRSGMRNISMRVSGPGSLSVSAPRWVSDAEVEGFVRSNAEWIFGQLDSLPQPIALSERFLRSPRIFVEGNALDVEFAHSSGPGFWVEDAARGRLVLAFDGGRGGALEALFVRYARGAIPRTVRCVAAELSLVPGPVSVRNQRGRWASRSSSGAMSFNWRVALLDWELQKYIVLHEFAHAEFMDHSVSFWICLNRMMPGARGVDRRLSRDGAEVMRVGR